MMGLYHLLFGDKNRINYDRHSNEGTAMRHELEATRPVLLDGLLDLLARRDLIEQPLDHRLLRFLGLGLVALE